MLKPIDAIKYIVKARSMYLTSVGDCSEELASNLVDDAKTIGAVNVKVIQRNGWWCVHSDVDWLQVGNDYPVLETFSRLLPLAGGGLNALRREVLLTAFADEVVTKKGADICVVKGAGLTREELAQLLYDIPTTDRVVLFRLASLKEERI